MSENPGLKLQTALTSVSLASRFFNPAIGSALKMAGEAFSTIISYMKNKEVIDAINALDDNTMDTALKCALESMTQTYCDAQDLAAIMAEAHKEDSENINTKELNDELKSVESRFTQGVELLAYELPDLIEWVRKVANGSPASDFISNTRTTSASEDFTVMKNLESSLKAIITQNETLFSQATGKAKETALRTVLKETVNTLSSGNPNREQDYSGSPNPVARQFSRINLLFRVAQGINAPLTLLSYPTPDNIELSIGFDLKVIEDRAQNILKEVLDIVSKRLTTYLILDPSSLLTEAKTVNQLGHLAPLKVLEDLIYYFMATERDLQQKRNEYADLGEVINTIKILTEVRAMLAAWDAGEYTTPADAAKAANSYITQIYQKLNLTYGETYISNRITKAIKWELNYESKKVLNQDVQTLLKVSGKDIIQKFLETLPAGDRSSILLSLDLDTARQVTSRNLEIFIQTFITNFIRALERAKESAGAHYEVLDFKDRSKNFIQDASNLKYSAEVCTLILTSLGYWPKDIPLQLCGGAIFPSTSAKVSDLKFDDILKEISSLRFRVEQRMCKFRDFLRQNTVKNFY
ncbi:hypothetical protein HZA26_00965 [Candidatus Nomurabacteria bacterium]|nr:hypothetical protein [Candidatus Nomurabacteria bacterium]